MKTFKVKLTNIGEIMKLKKFKFIDFLKPKKVRQMEKLMEDFKKGLVLEYHDPKNQKKKEDN